MNKKTLMCLSLVLTSSFLGACSDDASDTKIEIKPETKVSELFITHSAALVTKESGETATFAMALSADPGREVVINIHSLDLREGAVEPAVVVLDESNWSIPVPVTITGLEDGIVDGDIDYKVKLTEKTGEGIFDQLEAVEVDVKNIDIDFNITIDPDLDALTLRSPQLLTREDGPGVDFTLVLASQPTADVVIAIHANGDGDGEGLLSLNELSFSPNNWEQAQTVTVNPLSDSIADGDQQYVIEFGISSTDERYNAYKPVPIEVTNKDVDVVSVKLSRDRLLTREGGSGVNFSVALGSKPTADVDLLFDVSNPSEGRLSIDELSFSPDNWQEAQVVTVSPLKDGIVDGTQEYLIEFITSSDDVLYNAYEIAPIHVKNLDSDHMSGLDLPIRVVAGNITSGNGQSYDPGHGIRIFKALNPDIVMIQEFNMKESSIASMVADTFGPQFYHTVGKGQIPNGIVSRFPIIEHGAWSSNASSNRDWDWAIVDLPGPREVLVVSVHLNTKKHVIEMEPLRKKIEAKAAEGNYYVILGGDFNTKTRSDAEELFSPALEVRGPYPLDQKGQDGTNASREKPYDWVLCCPAWAEFEVPVVIGSHSYPDGHVFDSRVYGSLGELGDVKPVAASDSGSTNMQHMAVVRDFVFRY